MHTQNQPWGTMDAEIKVPSAENLELTKVASFKLGIRTHKKLIRTSSFFFNGQNMQKVNKDFFLFQWTI